MISLECNCRLHKIEIEKFKILKNGEHYLSVRIYQHKSAKTGKRIHPKLLGDVILTVKNAKKLKEYFKNV